MATIALAFLVKIVMAALVVRRLAEGGGRREAGVDRPQVSVVVPLCALSEKERRTALSTLALRYPRFEVLFCVYGHDEPFLPVLRHAMEARRDVDARILFGRDAITRNPKLDNLAKAWRAAKYDLVAFIDSGVDAPADLLDRLIGDWDEHTGVVSSPPIGVEPENFWAMVECAFLNTAQAFWLIGSDALEMAFVHGKVMLVDRRMFAVRGGFEALATDTAEDSAVTKGVRAAGLKVRILRRPVHQPLGRRSLAEIWKRQLRWAQLRLESFPHIYAVELLSTVHAPLLAALLLAGWQGSRWLWAAAAVSVGWYAIEAALARFAGWPSGPAYAAACVCRDALALMLWPAAFLAKGYVWRGNPVKLRA